MSAKMRTIAHVTSVFFQFAEQQNRLKSCKRASALFLSPENFYRRELNRTRLGSFMPQPLAKIRSMTGWEAPERLQGMRS